MVGGGTWLHMVKTHRGREGHRRKSLSQSSSRKASLPGAMGITEGSGSVCPGPETGWGQMGLGEEDAGGMQ